LKGKNSNGLSNPFCTVEHLDDMFETRVIENSLSPVWDEHITL